MKRCLLLIVTLIVILFAFEASHNHIEVKAEEIALEPNEKLAIDKIKTSPLEDIKVYFFEQTKENGDCCIIIIGNVEILVDGGPISNNAVGDQIIAKMESLVSSDNVWDYLIVSHADFDHIASLPRIMEKMFINGKYSLGTIIDFDITDNKDGLYNNITHIDEYFTTVKYLEYSSARKDCIAKGTKYYSSMRAYNHGPFMIENAELKVLYNYFYDHRENPDKKVSNVDKNLISVCFLITYGEQKLLFTGDMMEYNFPSTASSSSFRRVYGETKLYENNIEDLQGGVTFFKAAHHGSNTSNCKEFIDNIRPQYVVVPCVAGTSKDSSTYVEENEVPMKDRVPMLTPMSNFFKYTDKIFIPSEAVYKSETDLTTINKKSYYGDIVLVFNGNDVTSFTTNNCNEENIPNVIQETNWFKKNSFDQLYVYTFDEEIASYNNCTLLKYGSYDILIDCGSYNNNSMAFIPKIKNYCVDGVIDYLIVTGAQIANISQLVSNDLADGEKGVLDSFKVENVIDFGDNSPLIKKLGNKGMASNYKKRISELNTIKFDRGRIDLEISPHLKLTAIESVLRDPSDENKYSLTTIFKFYSKKLLFVGDLNDYDDLLNNYVEEIENVTFYRASNSPINSNTPDFMKTIHPKYTVIGSPLNYGNGIDFGTLDYCAHVLSAKGTRKSNVYPTAYIEGYNSVPINGDIEFFIRYLNGRSYSNPKLKSITKDGIAILLENTDYYNSLIKS